MESFQNPALLLPARIYRKYNPSRPSPPLRLEEHFAPYNERDKRLKTPPGKVRAPDALPAVSIITATRPKPKLCRSMLYDLIQEYGNETTARLLGVESSLAMLGHDAYFDAIVAETNRHTVWTMLASLRCPSNLTILYHIQTWGIFNEDYKGELPGLHRAAYKRTLSQAKKPRKKDTRSKIERNRERRLKQIPKELRYVTSDPEKVALREKLLAEVIQKEEARDRLSKKKAREDRARRKAAQDMRRRLDWSQGLKPFEKQPPAV